MMRALRALRAFTTRLQADARETYINTREFVRTSSEVIEEHKSLLWVIGTGSSALAGWAVYTARRLHYERIEEAISNISQKIAAIENAEKEQELFLGQQAETLGRAAQNTLEEGRKALPKLHMMLVVTPAVLSSFMLGYLVGRTQGSYKYHRQLQIGTGLAQHRVFVAAIPERLFEAGVAGKELEKAIVQASHEEEPVDTWWPGSWQRRLPPPSAR